MESIETLKKRIDSDGNLLCQQEGGFISKLGFSWNSPLNNEALERFEKEKKIILPEDYKKFLKISNGAILFRDTEYGQWGCKLLSIEDIINETKRIKKNGYEIKDGDLVFATWFGDGDFLIFDSEVYKNEKINYIIDGDQGYNSIDWEHLKGTFTQFIDRLIVSQGSKYWRW
jgi:hypothetical protein